MKFIKKLICKIFHIKACQCPDDVDEHVEYFTKVPESDTPVYKDNPIHCGSHSRFRKSCPACIAVRS